MEKEFETKYVTVGVCKYKEEFLLLKLSNDYPACPGD